MKIKPTLPAIERVISGGSQCRALMDHTFDVGQKSLVFWKVRQKSLDGTPNHGVFAHQDDSLAAE